MSNAPQNADMNDRSEHNEPPWWRDVLELGTGERGAEPVPAPGPRPRLHSQRSRSRSRRAVEIRIAKDRRAVERRSTRSRQADKLRSALRALPAEGSVRSAGSTSRR